MYFAFQRLFCYSDNFYSVFLCKRWGIELYVVNAEMVMGFKEDNYAGMFLADNYI